MQPFAPNDLIGDYRVIRLLGQGGQGAVYLASALDGQWVAIKLLHAHITGDDQARRRFLNEANVMRQVAPFCTTRVLDVGVFGQSPYIVSEFVEGESLGDRVARDGPRRGNGLDRLAVATLTALSAIHHAGIVHRDFKPSNVLLGPEGPVVIDFGIARALDSSTVTASIIGTPAFMSPEQVGGGMLSPVSDMFSWALTMVFAATGRSVFQRDSAAASMFAIMHEDADLGDVPEPFRTLARDCLSKDPRTRPNAAQAMQVLTGHAPLAATFVPQTPPASHAPPPLPPTHAAPPVPPLRAEPMPVPYTLPVSPRRPGRALVAIVAAIGVLGGGLALLSQAVRPGETASPTRSATTAPASKASPKIKPGEYPLNILIADRSGWEVTATRMDVGETELTLQIVYRNVASSTQTLTCASAFGGSHLDFSGVRVEPTDSFCASRLGQSLPVDSGQTLNSWGRFPVAEHAGQKFAITWFDWGKTQRTVTVPTE